MNIKIKSALASLAIMASLVTVGTVIGVAPAEANVAQGRFCEPVGWVTHWKAKKFYDGEFAGYGPLRFRRKTAWNDCNDYMS